MATQPTLINSVVRALRLLDAVGEASGPVPAKLLAHRTGLALGTTYHLLRTLAHEGYVVRTDDGFALGDRVDSLASARHSPIGPGRTRQVLGQLHDDLGAAAYLAVLDDGEVHIAEIYDSPGAPRTDLWVGLHEAAHATALGKAVLAALPEEGRRAYLAAHPMNDLTPRTLTTRRALLSELAAGDGVMVDREEYAVGTVCAAAALPSADVTAAVAVSAPVGRAKEVLASTDHLRRAATLLALAARR
ncbi:helix-turn-helix domain-containing protein [Georgenia yuyongxinii]|uniref:Helix-turn-helix domain-containing protein n=1 Tax=Georgenia yuyongxinii TaxID=2589797 RepID=A0A5B8C854_9MICO|nr:IclR family transcriptional regulator C-terminal domain-containing protein [Georgenia yuyongxinii]QDC24116.1 helix-turn-helix domain-containing protein [Georgenia yuyongxinii]